MFTVAPTFGSGLWVRSFAYEFFLLTHIVFPAILIVGLWYHVYDLYKYLGEYEVWICAMSAIWGFNRLVQIARMAMAGLRRAKVTDIGKSYLRIDVPGIRWGTEPGKNLYVYFPALSPLWPWENHPFLSCRWCCCNPPARAASLRLIARVQ